MPVWATYPHIEGLTNRVHCQSLPVSSLEEHSQSVEAGRPPGTLPSVAVSCLPSLRVRVSVSTG